MPPCSPFLLAAILALTAGICRAQPEIQTGRYTAVPAAPTDAQQDPLQAVVVVEFPEEIRTVGEALRHLLVDTGYAMQDAIDWEIEVFDLVQHPLPQVQRLLGPLTVLDALETLAGPAFDVSIDRVHRQVALGLAAAAPERGRDERAP